LQASQPATASSDRRMFPRRQSECSVTLVFRRETQRLTPREIDWLLQTGSLRGRLLDISQTGLCLLWNEQIPDNAEVVLRISNPQLNRHVDATARVINSKPGGHGRFSIHCRVVR